MQMAGCISKGHQAWPWAQQQLPPVLPCCILSRMHPEVRDAAQYHSAELKAAEMERGLCRLLLGQR